MKHPLGTYSLPTVLRSGYLYVYDEGIDWWSAYVVSKQGNLFEFDVEAAQPPSVGDRHPCSRGTDPYKARCITIPDVQSATRVWLGFSDTAWTKDVLDKHSDADYRNAHMTCINVAGWLNNSANQTHMAAFMRTTAGALLEALGDLPQDLVLGGVQNRLLTALAAAGYDASARHYVFIQQARLTEQQKLDFVTRVLQRMSAAPNSPAPMPIKHLVRNAHRAVAGEDAPPLQTVHGLAWLTQDSAETLGLATPDEQEQGKTGQWHVSSEATGSVDAETFTKTQAASTRLVTLDSTAFHVGVVGMLLSTWSFAGMAKQEYAASAGKTTHLAVTAAALAGQYMEVTGSVLQDTKWGATKLSKPLNKRYIRATTKAQRLAGVGRIVGALGGVVLGVWQLIKGGMAYDTNRSLAHFDIAVGTVTAFLSGLIFFGALAGFGFVLFIALAIVTFIWHFFVNDQYQNWLSRCYYGVGPNKFEDMVEQQTAFHRITTPKKTSKESAQESAEKHLYRGYRQIPGVS